MIIEPATEADARAIGVVHVLAWHETYRGTVPDAVLASLDPRERAGMWERVIGRGDGVVVLRSGPRIVGFGAAGANRDATLPHAGMVSALYLLSEAQRQGHGARIMAHLARHLLATGRRDAVLWVADANLGARRFYERIGGTIVSTTTEQHEGWELPCTAYGWDDLAGLLPHLP